MEQRITDGRLRRVLDSIGLRAFIFALAQGWFALLWGLSVPSMAAGLALGLLGQMALTRCRRDHAAAREETLRRRIGGELLLEDLLLSPQTTADARAAALLRRAFPELTPLREAPGGILCRYGEETLLVACAARPAQSEIGPADAAALARACRAEGADRAVLCACCRCAASLAAYVERLPVSVRIIPRETMLRLAGEAAPVTDEQLVALGARRRRLTVADIARGALRRVKARRYMTYGLALMLLYVVTGLRYYPVPGAVCMALAVGSRCVREEPPLL